MGGKEVINKKFKNELLTGPSDSEPDERQPKKAKTETGAGQQEKLIWVDGMQLDKEMLVAARKAAKDGTVDKTRAELISNAMTADGECSRYKRWTLRFIICAFPISQDAVQFLKEERDRLDQTDDVYA